MRAERLQEISEGDALAEGVTVLLDAYCASKITEPYTSPAQLEFWHLWESINGKNPGKNWESNPLVWRIEFKVVKQ